MEARKAAVAAVAILSATWAGSALAQSKAASPAPAPAPVATAVTVVAQREAVVTVVAPREASSGMPTGKRQYNPVRITKAVDADGDGLADAPATAERQGKTGSTKRVAATPAAATDTEDCDDKDERTACKDQNPLYTDGTQQGQNPLHRN